MKKLNELLGTRLPIIQGGMANIATGEFAAACSNAGALGIVASDGVRSAQELREQIARCRALTDRPVGVNIMLMHPCAEELAQVVIEERVPVVTTGAGNPGKYVPGWKDAGVTVIPVVAAGGIADGRQLAAALALGACGAQVGTCLLASAECPIHENYKQALLRARDSDTIVTGRSVGGPVRVLKNRMSREYVRQEQQGASLAELERLTLGGLRRVVLEGDVENGGVMAGQVAGMLHAIRPVQEILEGLYSDAMAVLERTQRDWLA